MPIQPPNERLTRERAHGDSGARARRLCVDGSAFDRTIVGLCRRAARFRPAALRTGKSDFAQKLIVYRNHELRIYFKFVGQVIG